MERHALRSVREAWARVEAAAAALPLDLTLADRVRSFDMLYESCRRQLEATEDLFGTLRQQELIAFQARLRKLAHAEPPSQPSGVPGRG